MNRERRGKLEAITRTRDAGKVRGLLSDWYKAPRECIDYVILHELCHIAEHNHSERFYRLMSQVMPDWAKTKERLDGMAGVIFCG